MAGGPATILGLPLLCAGVEGVAGCTVDTHLLGFLQTGLGEGPAARLYLALMRVAQPTCRGLCLLPAVWPGTPGTPGTSGTLGTLGTSGVSGTPGTPGTSRVSGMLETPGTPGTPGMSGTLGTPGMLGAGLELHSSTHALIHSSSARVLRTCVCQA